ncbi:MAG: hypothetical protein KGM44_08070, partial [bacterium]|nr:hypothetical protein [bacterium]
MRRMLYALGSLTSLAALASCGGGGGSTGGGVLPPGPSGSYVQATPAPGMAPAPAGFCVSSAQSSAVLSVTSNPQGAWVEATTSAGQTYLLGQTPQSCRLNPTTNGVKVTVLGGVGQTPQTTTVAGNKSTTIFFNAVADSSGQAGIGGGTLAAMRKPQTASVRASSANIPRRAVGRAAGSAVAPGAFSVVYRPGALAMEGRTPADVERGLGAQGRPIGTFAGMAWLGVRVDPSQAAS